MKSQTLKVCEHVQHVRQQTSRHIGNIYALDKRTRQLKLFRPDQTIVRRNYGHYYWELTGMYLVKVGKDKYQLPTQAV